MRIRRVLAGTFTFGFLILFGITRGQSAAIAQTGDYWRHALHTEALLDTLHAHMLHFSSWARNGGNSDMGEYYGTDASGWKIMCDVTGPGVVAELWCTRQPMPPTARMRIYVDNLTVALIDTPVTNFFGQTAPFTPPLADTSSGGYFSYVPIPFQSSLRITYSGLAHYYHVNVLSFPAGTTIQPFTMPSLPSYLAHLDSLQNRFNSPTVPAWPGRTYSVESASTTLSPGQTQELLNRIGSGGCRRLFLLIGDHTPSVLDDVWLRIYTDHNPFPDIEGPLSVLFGTALGWWPYRSVFMGMNGDSLYLNLPMAFGSQFRVEAQNLTAAQQSVSVFAELANLPLPEIPPFRVRGIYSDENPTRQWAGYTIADVEGAGNYLGTLLTVQPPDSHVYEGDETISIDGERYPSWRGTGTEDYFEGGYYWNDGHTYASLGFHGCIHFSGRNAAAYRWHVTDPVPYRSHFRMDLEVGGWNQLTGHYRSVAFFCVKPPRWRIADADGNRKTFPGESLRMVGFGLTPDAALLMVRMGTIPLELVTGTPVVSADSVLDVTTLAPSGMASGYYPLIIALSTGTETLDSAWLHLNEPVLSFTPHRLDLDTCVHAGDTLTVDILGLASGSTASILADNIALAWAGMAPAAESDGHLQGSAIVSSTLSSGNHVLRATIPGRMDATCSVQLKVRQFVRLEIEDLPVDSLQGFRRSISYAPDWLPDSSQEPWGRNLAYDLTGNAAGDFVLKTFSLPSAGTFQSVYFFGRTNTGAIIRTVIDDSTDVGDYDSYYGPINWRWTRSDTVHGVVRALAAGVHTIRFEIAGRNPESTGLRLILDQMLLQNAPENENAAPRAVCNLVAFADTGGVRLCWSPVHEDTAGQPVVPSSYIIYRSHVLGSVEFYAYVSGTDTTFFDAETRSGAPSIAYYFVRTQIGQDSLRPPRRP